MPDYFKYMISGYRLYFTSSCVVEAFHAHASNKRKHNESTAAKFFIYDNGDSRLVKQGDLKAQDVIAIQKFIKENYLSMYNTWSQYSNNTYYQKR